MGIPQYHVDSTAPTRNKSFDGMFQSQRSMRAACRQLWSHIMKLLRQYVLATSRFYNHNHNHAYVHIYIYNSYIYVYTTIYIQSYTYACANYWIEIEMFTFGIQPSYSAAPVRKWSWIQSAYLNPPSQIDIVTMKLVPLKWVRVPFLRFLHWAAIGANTCPRSFYVGRFVGPVCFCDNVT